MCLKIAEEKKHMIVEADEHNVSRISLDKMEFKQRIE